MQRAVQDDRVTALVALTLRHRVAGFRWPDHAARAPCKRLTRAPTPVFSASGTPARGCPRLLAWSCDVRRPHGTALPQRQRDGCSSLDPSISGPTPVHGCRRCGPFAPKTVWSTPSRFTKNTAQAGHAGVGQGTQHLRISKQWLGRRRSSGRQEAEHVFFRRAEPSFSAQMVRVETRIHELQAALRRLLCSWARATEPRCGLLSRRLNH
jgi:hypothetical protein